MLTKHNKSTILQTMFCVIYCCGLSWNKTLLSARGQCRQPCATPVTHGVLSCFFSPARSFIIGIRVIPTLTLPTVQTLWPTSRSFKCSNNNFTCFPPVNTKCICWIIKKGSLADLFTFHTSAELNWSLSSNNNKEIDLQVLFVLLALQMQLC